MFVSFEGIPGAGRKTHMEALAQKLRGKGFDPIITTGEPGWNNEVSGIIKYIALEGNTCAIEKLFLFLADRAGHFERFVRPLLTRGYGYPNTGQAIILCDGGPDSTLAYQGFGARLAPIPFLVEANRLATADFPINTTFVLDVDPGKIVERLDPIKKKKFESLDPEMLKRIRLGYSEIAKAEPERVVMVNNNADFEAANNTMLSLIVTRAPTQKAIHAPPRY